MPSSPTSPPTTGRSRRRSALRWQTAGERYAPDQAAAGTTESQAVDSRPRGPGRVRTTTVTRITTMASTTDPRRPGQLLTQCPCGAAGLLGRTLEKPMSVRRLEGIPGFNIDRVAAAAGDDPDVLRLENLDTDIPPPAEALEATRAAIGEDEANSWLPFTGRDDLKEAAAAHIERRGGPHYDGRREIVITSGEGEAMLDALLCLTDPGD